MDLPCKRIAPFSPDDFLKDTLIIYQTFSAIQALFSLKVPVPLLGMEKSPWRYVVLEPRKFSDFPIIPTPVKFNVKFNHSCPGSLVSRKNFSFLLSRSFIREPFLLRLLNALTAHLLHLTYVFYHISFTPSGDLMYIRPRSAWPTGTQERGVPTTPQPKRLPQDPRLSPPPPPLPSRISLGLSHAILWFTTNSVL